MGAWAVTDVVDYAVAVQGLESWERVLRDQPDVMHSLISDIVKIVQSQGDEDRIGRRPAPDAVGYDELFELLMPKRFSVDPLPVALRELIGPLTQKQFAIKACTSRPYISQMLAGSRVPSMDMMAALARAGGVTPAYFIEWRGARLAQILTSILCTDPQWSASFAKRLAGRS